jgi:hypothetical protein
MPRISEFFGIEIYMYFDDHPAPLFHALYAEHDAAISIDTCAIQAGGIPTPKLAQIREWAKLHKGELLANWELARRHLPLNSIAPLQ